MAIIHPSDQWGNEYGFLGKPRKVTIHKFMTFGEEVHKINHVVVHEFKMGDVEDPDLYAAEPLYQWQQSEMGQWVMEHSVETPTWSRYADTLQWGFQYKITAYLKERDYTFWVLKWASTQ
jgi:hypothetical protein